MSSAVSESGSILLVGGTGFLGSFVAARLAQRGVVVLARPSSERAVLPASVEVRVGDLDGPLPLEGVTSIVYCASMGFGHVPPLVRQLEAKGIERAVFVSTTAIFTSLPSTSRAVRLEAEAAVQASALAWTLLRPTMIYGTRRDRNISRLLRFLKRWPVFPVCGNALWQPVHVDDLAAGVVAAFDSRQAVGHAYNLAGAQPLPFATLVRTAARAVRRDILLLPVPVQAAVVAARLTRVVTPEQIRRLAEDKAFSWAEAEKDFAYAPRSFDAGVRQEAQTLGLG